MTIVGRSQLLTPGEVAVMFRVDPKTVTRWASAGRIGSVRTPGGHRRFLKADIDVLLDRLTTDRSSAEDQPHHQQLALSATRHHD
jgi:excisionase family DNA binding protein